MTMIKFQYTINFDDTNNKTFEINVDEKTFIIKDDDNVAAPEWTLLANNKCTHCPYNTDKVKYCPVAKNLSQAADTFGDKKSFTEVTVFVKTENRMYGKKTDLQTALFSLFGLLMATSNCPHLHIFKPMARFHLPFSTTEETTVRSLGMHLIHEYLLFQENENHKISLDNLTKKYEAVADVNRGIIQRIRSLKGGGDASKNAVIVLDNFASLLPLEISSGLSEIKNLFD